MHFVLEPRFEKKDVKLTRAFTNRLFFLWVPLSVVLAPIIASCQPEEEPVENLVEGLKQYGIEYLTGNDGLPINAEFRTQSELDVQLEINSWEFPKIDEAPEQHRLLLKAVDEALHFFPRDTYWESRKGTLTPDLKTRIFPAFTDTPEGYLYYQQMNSPQMNDLYLNLPRSVDEDPDNVRKTVLTAFVFRLFVQNEKLLEKYLYPAINAGSREDQMKTAIELQVALMLGDSDSFGNLIDTGRVVDDDRLIERSAIVMDTATGFPSFKPEYTTFLNNVWGGEDPIHAANKQFGWLRDNDKK